MSQSFKSPRFSWKLPLPSNLYSNRASSRSPSTIMAVERPHSPPLFELPGPLPPPPVFVPRQRPVPPPSQSRFSLKSFTSLKLFKEDSDNLREARDNKLATSSIAPAEEPGLENHDRDTPPTFIRTDPTVPQVAPLLSYSPDIRCSLNAIFLDMDLTAEPIEGLGSELVVEVDSGPEIEEVTANTDIIEQGASIIPKVETSSRGPEEPEVIIQSTGGSATVPEPIHDAEPSRDVSFESNNVLGSPSLEQAQTGDASHVVPSQELEEDGQEIFFTPEAHIPLPETKPPSPMNKELPPLPPSAANPPPSRPIPEPVLNRAPSRRPPPRPDGEVQSTPTIPCLPAPTDYDTPVTKPVDPPEQFVDASITHTLDEETVEDENRPDSLSCRPSPMARGRSGMPTVSGVHDLDNGDLEIREEENDHQDTSPIRLPVTKEGNTEGSTEEVGHPYDQEDTDIWQTNTASQPTALGTFMSRGRAAMPTDIADDKLEGAATNIQQIDNDSRRTSPIRKPPVPVTRGRKMDIAAQSVGVPEDGSQEASVGDRSTSQIRRPPVPITKCRKEVSPPKTGSMPPSIRSGSITPDDPSEPLVPMKSVKMLAAEISSMAAGSLPRPPATPPLRPKSITPPDIPDRPTSPAGKPPVAPKPSHFRSSSIALGSSSADAQSITRSRPGSMNVRMSTSQTAEDASKSESRSGMRPPIPAGMPRAKQPSPERQAAENQETLSRESSPSDEMTERPDVRSLIEKLEEMKPAGERKGTDEGKVAKGAGDISSSKGEERRHWGAPPAALALGRVVGSAKPNPH